MQAPVGEHLITDGADGVNIGCQCKGTACELFRGGILNAMSRWSGGIVSEVAPHADLMDRALALAARIAANPPLALAAMKEGLRRAAYGDPREIGAWAIGQRGGPLFPGEITLLR